MQFRCNEPTIAFEILDDDVIVINLNSGTYYSIVDCGADIWSALIAGMTVTEITNRLNSSATVGQVQVAAEVERFVEELINEQLIVAADDTAGDNSQTDPVFKTTFTSPRLQKFTDMQELLLVDPIHEVSEEGWPLKENDKA